MRPPARWSRRRNLDDRPAVLVLVSVLLVLSLVLHWITTAAIFAVPVSVAVAAMSMGAMNSVFHSGGEVSLGVTYMTGAVVKSAHRLIDALAGGSWAPYRQQVALWSALVLGGLSGALLHVVMGVNALLLAAAVVIGALVVTVWLRMREYRIP